MSHPEPDHIDFGQIFEQAGEGRICIRDGLLGD
jgi:hypothetical protein